MKHFLDNLNDVITSINTILEKKVLKENEKKGFLTVLINSYYMKAIYYQSIHKLKEAQNYYLKIVNINNKDIDVFKPTMYLSLANLSIIKSGKRRICR